MARRGLAVHNKGQLLPRMCTCAHLYIIGITTLHRATQYHRITLRFLHFLQHVQCSPQSHAPGGQAHPSLHLSHAHGALAAAVQHTGPVAPGTFFSAGQHVHAGPQLQLSVQVHALPHAAHDSMARRCLCLISAGGVS